jgi:hypothetical protein
MELDMAAMAREFAENLGKAGVPLDFTPASLAHIDSLIATIVKKLPPATVPEGKQKRAMACLNIGAYVGEVLRLHEGGVWVMGDDNVYLLDLGALQAPVIQAMFGFMTDGKVSTPSGPADSVVSYYQTASSLNAAWLVTTVCGRHSNLESLHREMSHDADLAQWLSSQAQIAIKTARTKWDLALDFGPDSLRKVESVLAQLHDALKTAAPEERPTEKQIEAASIIWGVYVGEVIRRQYGGKWELTPDGVLQLTINASTLFPLRKVQKRITDGPQDNVAFYCHALKRVFEEVAKEHAAR